MPLDASVGHSPDDIGDELPARTRPGPGRPRRGGARGAVLVLVVHTAAVGPCRRPGAAVAVPLRATLPVRASAAAGVGPAPVAADRAALAVQLARRGAAVQGVPAASASAVGALNQAARVPVVVSVVDGGAVVGVRAHDEAGVVVANASVAQVLHRDGLALGHLVVLGLWPPVHLVLLEELPLVLLAPGGAPRHTAVPVVHRAAVLDDVVVGRVDCRLVRLSGRLRGRGAPVRRGHKDAGLE